MEKISCLCQLVAGTGILYGFLGSTNFSLTYLLIYGSFIRNIGPSRVTALKNFENPGGQLS